MEQYWSSGTTWQRPDQHNCSAKVLEQVLCCLLCVAVVESWRQAEQWHETAALLVRPAADEAGPQLEVPRLPWLVAVEYAHTRLSLRGSTSQQTGSQLQAVKGSQPQVLKATPLQAVKASQLQMPKGSQL